MAPSVSIEPGVMNSVPKEGFNELLSGQIIPNNTREGFNELLSGQIMPNDPTYKDLFPIDGCVHLVKVGRY